MYKKMASLLVILLIGGCASKVDFTQGVSEEDKKLLSSYEDKLLSIKDGIRITENGFFPKDNIPKSGFSKYKHRNAYKSKYSSKVASYLKTKRFNLKKFMHDVNAGSLKEFRLKLLKSISKYPKQSFDTLFIKNEKELDTLLSSQTDKKDKEKILARIKSSVHIKNACPKRYYSIEKESCSYVPSSNDSSESYSSGSYSSESYSSGSYSSGSYSSGGGNSGCKIQTVYVPGGNGRTAQTTICN